MQSVDWQRIAPEVAKQLLGEPTSTSSKEFRWGSKGSLVLSLDTGTWYNFEDDTGGGIIDLIKHLNQDVNTVLKQFGYDLALHSNDSLLSGFTPPKSKTTGNARSFSKVQMRELHSQAIVKVQYAKNFWVMRFPDGHFIKQKYAPFSLNDDGSWSMKRPEGSLPIYYTDKAKDKPIIINEGEKALRGCEEIYDGDSCTWHGGVNSWEKADWSPIFGRDVWVFPDNDEAGMKCAEGLHKYLKKNGCNVSIIKPPSEFKEKDDLYDAYESGYFKSSEELEKYAEQHKVYVGGNEFEFLSYDEMEANDRPPEWLIDKIAEKETVVSIYAEPKTGKSFVGISMMLSIATGTEWYGYNTEESGVLYFCGEGEKSIFKRILAWEEHFETPLRGKKFRVSNRPARILDDEDYEDVLAKAHKAKAEFGKLGLIVIDTLQRNFGSGDENSTSDMNLFIQRIDRLKFETGACIMLIHHTGHAGSKSNGIRRGRGSSVLPASVDSEFFIERKDEDNTGGVLGLEEKVMYVKMSQTLNKEDMNMPSINFRMDTVKNLGKNKDKKSAVLVKVDDSEMPIKTADNIITDKQQLVLDALLNLPMLDNPTSPQDMLYLPADLFGRIQDGKNLMKKEAIDDRLGELKSKCKVKHIPYKGYQHIKYGGLESDFNE
jgi:5S rRNA maturation endonuclease (ribonuclease M5)